MKGSVTDMEFKTEFKRLVQVKTDIWKGKLYYIAKTQVFDRLYSETGDTEEEALDNLRSAVSENAGVAAAPDGYPKLIEVDW